MTEEEILRLKKDIIDFLLKIPIFDDKEGREMLIRRVTSDENIIGQLKYDDKVIFCNMLVNKFFPRIGTFQDGRSPLEPVLEEVKIFVEHSIKKHCNIFMQKLKDYYAEYKESEDDTEPIINNAEIFWSCPCDIEKIIQTKYSCAQHIQRHQLLGEIKEYFFKSNPTSNYIVLYGKPQVGKSRFLYCLSQVVGNNYAPLIINVKDLEPNIFAFKLMYHLTRKSNDFWRKANHPVNMAIPNPKKFTEKTFFDQWKIIRHFFMEKTPVVMLNKIEILLSQKESGTNIFEFLNKLIFSSKDTYFILSVSEQIHNNSNNKYLNDLVTNGKCIRIDQYNEETTENFFSETPKMLSCNQECAIYNLKKTKQQEFLKY